MTDRPMTPTEIRALPLSELEQEGAFVYDKARAPGAAWWWELSPVERGLLLRFLREALARRAERAEAWREPAVPALP